MIRLAPAACRLESGIDRRHMVLHRFFTTRNQRKGYGKLLRDKEIDLQTWPMTRIMPRISAPADRIEQTDLRLAADHAQPISGAKRTLRV